MSLMFEDCSMSSMVFILSGFTSIPRLLTIKPKNFLAETRRRIWLGLTSYCSSSGLETPRLGGLCGARP